MKLLSIAPAANSAPQILLARSSAMITDAVYAERDMGLDREIVDRIRNRCV